jgi:hypothetical protein
LISPVTETPPIELSVVRAEFDVAFYLARNRNVKEQGLDPVEHYIREGWKKGLDPNRHFDTRSYLKRYPDVAAAGINPFYHYLVHGKAEGRSPRRRWVGGGEWSTKMLRRLKTVYIDTKYGYPLRDILHHTQDHEGAHATMVSGDYEQIRMLDSLTNPNDVLVDVGCGQGRMINYWLEKKTNNRIVGIENDEGIADTTRERLKKYRNVEIICGDATQCTPLDATFIYMFNPFDFEVTRKFADYIWDNRNHYRQNNLQILLYNCESFAAFDISRFVQRKIPPGVHRGAGYYERSIIRLRDQ